MPRPSAIPRALVFLLLAGSVSARAQQQPSEPVLPVAPPATSPAAPAASVQLQTRDLSIERPPQAVMINGRPYLPPTQRQLFHDYLIDSYGLPAFARSTVRTLYNEERDQPRGWGEDATGFFQRYASNIGITAINGTVRYGMEEVLHEDLRYIPCHGCSAKHKLENALLAEITARHHADGRRFFTLTPVVADYSGALIARYAWYPPGSRVSPLYGSLLGFRTVFATRIGSHLFREFVLERRHHDAVEGTATATAAAPLTP